MQFYDGSAVSAAERISAQMRVCEQGVCQQAVERLRQNKKILPQPKLVGEALNLFINYLGRRYVRVASPRRDSSLPLSTRALVEKIFNLNQINYPRRGRLYFSLLYTPTQA